MERTTQQYAVLTYADWHTDRNAIPVSDEQNAVQKALDVGCIAFSTYETTIIELEGEEFKGTPKNRSSRRYVGIDRLYSRDEMFQAMEKIWGSGYPSPGVRQAFMEYPEGDVYITGLERAGEFIHVKDTEKVFSRTGQQLWPAPLPDVILANDVTAFQKTTTSFPKP
jgi:hypothetical protein